MLSIEPMKRLFAELRVLPSASRFGLVVIVIAGVVDVVVHVFGTPAHAAHHGFVPEHAAHVLGLGGMVLVLAGVVIHGVRRQLTSRASAAIKGGLERNAPR
jgi:hypothetical protein